MDILGVGIPEVLVILALAMMVFGPRRLPEIARQIGRYVGHIQRMAYQIRTDWQDEISSVQQLKQEITGEAEKVAQIMPPTPKQVTQEIRDQVKNTISISKPTNTSPVTNSDSAKQIATHE